MARRLLVLFSTALRVKAIGKEGKLDSHPLLRLDFLTVLQHLAAGPPLDPGAGVSKLPHGASRTASNALLGIQVLPGA